MTTFRHRFIYARSTPGSSPHELLSGHYDVGLFAPSWDQRCETILRAPEVTFGTSIVFDFSTKDELGLQIKHASRVRFHLQSRSNVIEVLEGDAIDLSLLWNALWDKVREIAERQINPLRVLVDLSTCPRYYSLGFVAGLLRFGMARPITVLYAEGAYKGDAGSHRIDYPFTSGKWSATAIPFLKGSPDPLKGKAYFVSVGFEGAKTERVLAREDPDSVAMLFPDPGVDEDYPRRTWERNKEIIEQYGIEEERIIRARAGDAIAAWKSLAQRNLEIRRDESPYYLCCGTKPHSLAMALRAIAQQNATVMYNRPAGHTVVEVEPTGVYWSYEIYDLTTPMRTT